jgi:FAD/FMN-containing dehydrogenase
VVTLANWARANEYRLRAKGMSHGWSPILLPAGNTGACYVLLDTSQHLTSIAATAGSPATVTVQAGATMDNLMTALAAAGYGLCALPAPGDITVGGMLAINAHGSAIPGAGETRLPGQTYGSLSNLILSLTAVVWNSAPALSAEVTSPYNYGFTNSVTTAENTFFQQVASDFLHPVHQPSHLLPESGPVPDERADQDPGHRAGPAFGGGGERRAVANPVLCPAPAACRSAQEQPGGQLEVVADVIG